MQTEETKGVDTPVGNAEMRKVAEMQAQAFYEIVGLHLDRLMGIMVSNNGVSFQRKIQASKALKTAVQAALKFGVKTNLGLPEKGQALANETTELAVVLAQAMENKMLLLADNYRKTAEADDQVDQAEVEQNKEQTEQEAQGEVENV